ncbi:MAG: 2-C-methyl-D-erythritol 4-phosphate cytidylyltransferase [Phycisphaerales bacterium]|nr:2-C-methyl-D-erythritol 4-phosphate cytidylyltransferase [Phycisphaerales bacterium]
MKTHPTFGVVLPAAGSGTRFGSGDKLLMDLAGQTVLERSLALFVSRENVQKIVIVTSPDRFEPYRRQLPAMIASERLAFVAGGRERWESVLFGLRHLAQLKNPPTFVAVHDAARPLTPPSVIDQAFRTTESHGAALPCVAEPATLKKTAPDNSVSETVDRRGLFQAQTPQCFGLAKLLSGYETLLAAGQIADVTDDAQVFERIGERVIITPGDSLNMKITTAGDLALARAIFTHGSAPA